jgi:uncharacterized membrane protein
MIKQVNAQSRWKSKYLWGALLAQIAAILEYLGVWKSCGVDLGWVNTLIAMVLQVAVTVGILNNATDKDNW